MFSADAGVLDELNEDEDLKLSQEDLKILDTILTSPQKAAEEDAGQAKSSSRGRGRGGRGKGRGRGVRAKGKKDAKADGKKPRCESHESLSCSRECPHQKNLIIGEARYEERDVWPDIVWESDMAFKTPTGMINIVWRTTESLGRAFLLTMSTI